LTREVDEPETFKNAPITVQVVGRTLEDEAVIAMSEIVDQALKAQKVKL
jgi:amidase